MKLTEKDKTLLFILGVLALGCLPFFLVTQPCLDKSNSLEEEIWGLENRKNELMELESNREVYTQEILQAEEETEALLTRFPSALPQEGSLLFLHDTEQRIPITLSQVAYDTEAVLPVAAGTQDGGAQEAETGDGSNGEESTGEGTEETTGAGTAVSALSGYTGVCAQSQIIYSAEYKNFKDFLSYILEYENRTVISELKVEYSADMNSIMGNLVLKQYAVAGEDRKPVSVREPDLSHGTSNVFLQASGIAAPEQAEGEQADFFLMLSQPEADVEAVIFGQSLDGSGKTHLTSEENKLQEMAVSFKGSDGSYTANYQIGDEKLSDSGEGIRFTKEGAIVFEVISSPRVGDSDKVAASLEVINKTDRKVIVVIKNDDEEPRVTVAGKTGDVTVKQK